MAVDESGFKRSIAFTDPLESGNDNLDPFWATRLWQHLVQHVLSDVTVGRHRYIFKCYEDVFDGVSIVDAVLKCLTSCALQNLPKDISRSNAIKVCQVLMNNKLFESVVPKGGKKFEDSSLRLYRFVKDVNIENSSLYRDSDKENRQSRDVNPSYDWGAELSRVCSTENINELNQNICKSGHSSVRHVNHSLRQKLHTGSVSHVLKSNTKLLGGRSSLRGLPSMKSRAKPVHLVQVSLHPYEAPDNVSEDIHSRMHDTALMHLLAVLDIPILEGILSVPDTLLKVERSSPQLVIPNCSAQNADLSLRYGNLNYIPWISSALACLDGKYPQGVGNLWSLQACKLLCYESVVERFADSPCCIIPNSFITICTSIVELLRSCQRKKALSVMQLFMMILPWQRRQQLRFLLEFLHLVIEDIFVSVDRRVTNYEAVSRDFLSVIMDHPCVSKENFQILFDFMVYKVDQIFQVPECLRCYQGISFCRQTSVENMMKLSSKLTANSLQKLAFIVMDSTELKLTTKKQWLKKLKRYHPEIHELCSCG